MADGRWQMVKEKQSSTITMATQAPYQWRVVPVSDNQRLDISPSNLLNDGHFRICNTSNSRMPDYLPAWARNHYNSREYVGESMPTIDELSEQFVVQLFGCPLDCPYCYVTHEGVWGDYHLYTTEQLVDAFVDSGCTVFHLMGGAPAAYIDHWSEIIKRLPARAFFTSDLMLIEHPYPRETLDNIAQRQCLYAVNIKGLDSQEFDNNTNRPFDEKLLYDNLQRVIEQPIPFYVTFTGINRQHAAAWARIHLPWYINWHCIDIVDYDATVFNDSIPWGHGGKEIRSAL